MAGWPTRDTRAVTARIDDVLERFPELGARRHEPAGNLSGGEQQMLTLAMAAVAQPRLLLVDELSHALAPELIARVRQLLDDLQSGGTTILIVEQSVDLALDIADRAYFLEKGEIRFAGPARELRDHPELLRAVFLGGTGDVSTSRARADEPPTSETVSSLELTAVGKRYGGVVALDDVSFTVGARRDRGRDRHQRRRQDHALRRDLGVSWVPTRARSRCAIATVDSAPSTGCPHTRVRGLGLGRTFQDGRLFPALTVRETIAVACERTTRAHDPIATALRLPMVTRSEGRVWARVDELIDTSGSTRSPTSSSTSSRPAPAGSSTSRACWPTSRACCSSTSRRAGSRSAKPRRWRRCCCACATRSVRACS